MGNTIQQYSLHDLSMYRKDYKLNISIDELNKRNAENRDGSFAVVGKDDAAALRISELARTLYASSVQEESEPAQNQEQKAAGAEPMVQNAKSAEEPARTMAAGEAETDKAAEETDQTPDKYAGLSGAEREIKELEDYIASHPADTSIDPLRNRKNLLSANAQAIDLRDENVRIAGRAYAANLSVVADQFTDFSGKITYGDYSSNDVNAQDLNFDAIDDMEEMYQSYKQQIQESYTGEEGQKYLDELDEAYRSVFQEKIINPVQSAYDDKLTFFQPDSEEVMQSIKAASTDKESLQSMVSGYLTNQSVQRTNYAALSDGTKAFYDFAKDSSGWHDSDRIKTVFSSTMDSYASMQEVKADSGEYLSAKSAADAISKKISDQYAENTKLQLDKLGLNRNGMQMELDEDVKAGIMDYITDSTSGMYMIDFSKIVNLDKMLEDNLR